ncbi:hypothetical protein [Actinopolymorpha alba]|uniref:hypothetical protein n=1 Tax=Actinopolymorpha alba TaxID=533267 RepID=UPI0003734AA3|nr:hypothetical protein [Actinopolymorpha alba]
MTDSAADRDAYAGSSNDRHEVEISYTDGQTVHKSVSASEARRIEKEFERNKDITVIRVTPAK